MKRTGLIFIGLGSIIFVLIVVQISVENMLSTGGIKLSVIEEETQNLQRENAILNEKVLSLSALTYIAQQAEKEGFTQDASNTLVISNTQPPLALKQ